MATATETPAVRKLRMRRTSYLHHYGETDPRTVAVTRALAEARAAVAEAEARRLREAADLLAAS
jgi:hypothetical protein